MTTVKPSLKSIYYDAPWIGILPSNLFAVRHCKWVTWKACVRGLVHRCRFPHFCTRIKKYIQNGWMIIFSRFLYRNSIITFLIHSDWKVVTHHYAILQLLLKIESSWNEMKMDCQKTSFTSSFIGSLRFKKVCHIKWGSHVTAAVTFPTFCNH